MGEPDGVTPPGRGRASTIGPLRDLSTRARFTLPANATWRRNMTTYSSCCSSGTPAWANLAFCSVLRMIHIQRATSAPLALTSHLLGLFVCPLAPLLALPC